MGVVARAGVPMNPPLSMILFTTLAGTAQGLMLALVGLELASARVPTLLYLTGAALVLGLSAIGLAAATFHLGHPLRAWRAVAMWRSSWLSREVIAMPLFMAVVFAWALAQWGHAPTRAWALVAAVLALAMYLCTGMIYAAVKAIAAWAHAITPVNFLLLGLASGLTLASALAAAYALPVTAPLVQAALAFTLVSAATRGWSLRRNLNLAPAATLQSAIGVRHPRIVQISQGMTAGSFGTREFFHGAGAGFVLRMRWAAALLGFVLPALLLLAVLAFGALPAALTALAFAAQSLGLLAERWCFFAEGQHTQNLYHSSMRA